MSRSQRRAMIDREEPNLSLVRQCALLGISRSSLYYLPTEAGAEDLELMALIDQQYLKTPFYGSRRMTAWLSNHGHQVNRKRVRRLMQLIGLEAIYRRPNTSKPNPGHKVYPYLLRGLEINRVNQVWATDITYIPMARGFLYLVAIMDWHSRYVLAWRLSNTLEVDFCVAALEEALSKGRPQIFNTDQGSQFTSEAFTSMLLAPFEGHASPGLAYSALRVGPNEVASVVLSQWPDCRFPDLSLTGEGENLKWVAFCKTDAGLLSATVDNERGEFHSRWGGPAPIPPTATPRSR